MQGTTNILLHPSENEVCIFVMLMQIYDGFRTIYFLYYMYFKLFYWTDLHFIKLN